MDYKNAAENIKLNNCTEIQLLKSNNFPIWKNCDIILANINRNVILENIAFNFCEFQKWRQAYFKRTIARDENRSLISSGQWNLKIGWLAKKQLDLLRLLSI